MSQLRLCSFTILGLLIATVPSSLAARQLDDHCRQLRTSLAQRLLALKQKQAAEIAQCLNTNGPASQICSDLKESQREEMKQLEEYHRLQLSNCTNTVPSFFVENQIYYHRHYYHQASYFNSHPHQPRFPGHGPHGINGGHNAATSSGHIVAGSTVHTGGSFGHSASGSFSHSGGSTGGGGGVVSVSHNGGGYSGGGNNSGNHSSGGGGFSGGSGASASSSSAGSSGGHVK